jgi:hypothetical protein
MENVPYRWNPDCTVGHSLVYLLAGGGIFGAGVIFIAAKLLGR